MSTVKEVKAATQGLSPQERWELYRWLGDSKDVQEYRREELRQEIALGIVDANSGNIAPLDMESIKAKVRQKLKNGLH